MSRKVKWGFLGCGIVANKFAKGLETVAGAELAAVASRTAGKAEEFARKYSVQDYYDNYEDLVKNPEIDVIYVSTTHNFHYENVLLCLENNKHVLCEKAFTINALQAQQVIRKAREMRLFLMEAMWTRFLPCTIELKRILSEELIGDIKLFTADFGFRVEWNPEHRLLNPILAGGTLLDLGIYPISFASMIFKQPPIAMKSFASIGKSDVDEHVGYLFEYEKGAKTLITTSYQITTPHDAMIAGTKGYIKIPVFYNPTKMILKLEGEDEKLLELPFKSTGYNYEIAEVNRCIREGKIESEIMPLDETLEIMNTMDALRLEWGLKYPEET